MASQPVTSQPVLGKRQKQRRRGSRTGSLARVPTAPRSFFRELQDLQTPASSPAANYLVCNLRGGSGGGIYSFANSLRHPINTKHTHRGITPFLPYPFLRQRAAPLPFTSSRDGAPPLLHEVIYALIILPSVAIMLLLIFLLIF